MNTNTKFMNYKITDSDHIFDMCYYLEDKFAENNKFNYDRGEHNEKVKQYILIFTDNNLGKPQKRILAVYHLKGNTITSQQQLKDDTVYKFIPSDQIPEELKNEPFLKIIISYDGYYRNNTLFYPAYYFKTNDEEREKAQLYAKQEALKDEIIYDFPIIW